MYLSTISTFLVEVVDGVAEDVAAMLAPTLFVFPEEADTDPLLPHATNINDKNITKKRIDRLGMTSISSYMDYGVFGYILSFV